MTARSVSDLAADVRGGILPPHTASNRYEHQKALAALAELVARLEAAEAQVAALTQERDEWRDLAAKEAKAGIARDKEREAAEATLADTRRALEEIAALGWDNEDPTADIARRALGATGGGTACPRCDGTGDDSQRDGPCSRCQGTGQEQQP